MNHVSFEFFPPRTEEGANKLLTVSEQLLAYEPEFFSVTFGAGGSTQAKTLETVLAVHEKTGVDVAPHISCINQSKADLRALILDYQDKGIKRLVVLRGDVPSGTQNTGELRYANELVEFIRQETGEHFHIEVAAYPEYHPQAKNPIADFDNFKRKVEAGANSAITQYFFNADAYADFVERSLTAGIKIDIIPGIMPITNYKQIAHFSDICGAEIPKWIRERLAHYEAKDDMESLRAFGVDVVARLCDNLMQNDAPGLHFYTLNKFEPTDQILQAI